MAGPSVEILPPDPLCLQEIIVGHRPSTGALRAASSPVILVRMFAFFRSCVGLAAALLFLAGFALAAEPREETAPATNPGNLRMFSYLPERLAPKAPLVVLLHGCKQDAVGFARDAGWLALADRAGFALLMPEQKGLPGYLQRFPVFPWIVAVWGANNQYACFNWFAPEDTVRDRGEALSIRAMIDAMVERYAVDPARVYIAGLSAGGAMAAVMLAAYPERFAGGAIVAGIPYGCAGTASRALQCMKPGIDLSPAEWQARFGASGGTGRAPPVTIWQGEDDAVVAPANARELVEQWAARHGIAAPPRREQQGSLTRELYVGEDGKVLVESVRIAGFPHAFPIAPGGAVPCGQPSEFVVAGEVCAARQMLRFWGLPGGD